MLTGPELATLADSLATLPLPTSTLCLELPLGGGPRRNGFALGLGALADPALQAALDAVSGRAPDAWGPSVALLASASAPGASLARVPFTYLAFDGLDARAAAPCVSLCADEAFVARSFGLAPPAPQPAQVEALLAHGFHALTGGPLPSAIRGRLHAVLAIHPELWARHVSVMAGRAPTACKLDLRLPSAALEDFLAEVRWSGCAADVRALLRRLDPRAQHVQLNHVLGAAPEHALELELGAAVFGLGAAERRRLLAELAQAGHVTSAEAHALTAVVEAPMCQSEGDGHAAQSSYLKVQVGPSGVVGVKAYLGIMPRNRAAAARAQRSLA